MDGERFRQQVGPAQAAVVTVELADRPAGEALAPWAEVAKRLVTS